MNKIEHQFWYSGTHIVIAEIKNFTYCFNFNNIKEYEL